MSILDLLPGPVVSGDDRFATVSVPSGGTETNVISTFRTRIGVRCFVVVLATNTAGSAGNITWNLKADGSKMFPYADFSVSPSDPSLWRHLPFPVEVPQNCEVSVTAKNAGASASDCTARIVVYYVEMK